MGNDMMDLEQLADYLQRDARELNKLASRGHLPGHKVSGRWRFARAEINQWLETQLPAAIAEAVIAYGRTASGIPFGAAGGGLTDIFFLFCCQDETTHMRILTRLSRLLLRPGFVDELRAAETAADTWQLIQAAEKELA